MADSIGNSMSGDELLHAGSRVALAAYLHDLGKFAERARIDAAQVRDSDGNTRVDVNKQLYCPSFDGRYTHVHAAYTAIAFDLLESHLPDLVGQDMAPFRPWSDRDADDSLINAAARHHRPDTFLQWIVATADRVASGFERDEFEAYNRAADANHYSARQLTLFEQVRLFGQDRVQKHAWRYPLRPMSPDAIFPIKADGYENPDRQRGQDEYRDLWDSFVAALERIPRAHRFNLPLWLDHFDTLWQCHTQAIPSATAGNVKPEVSLYDHSRTTAALAVALWRYHYDRGDTGTAAAERLRTRADWGEDKFLLVQGDFFGIQDFIFAAGGETQRRAAKLLRGRSLYVSLLVECAALAVLEKLGLPPTSQIVNAAGRFLIVAPNTERTHAGLVDVRRRLDGWFLEHTFGQAGIGLVGQTAACNDFRHGRQGASPFGNLMRRLFQTLEEAKLQRFDLCGESSPAPVFDTFLDCFDSELGACAVDGRSPASEILTEGGPAVSRLAADQMDLGGWVASESQTRISIAASPIGGRSLRQALFGYAVNVTSAAETSGAFGDQARSGNIRRFWDFALPEGGDVPVWNGYARRPINAYVPRFPFDSQASDGNANLATDAGGIGGRAREQMTFEDLAREDMRRDDHGRRIGVEALMTLKGDVDNLGLIFEHGLDNYSFAKMAGLSRQLSAFFSTHLPRLCAQEFPNSYVVFAGGDDFMLIGPWLQTLRLANRMRADFHHYVAENPDVHFSAGLSMTKPGIPVRELSRISEESLEHAKRVGPATRPAEAKNAVTAFGRSVSWRRFDELLGAAERLLQLADAYSLPTSYLYALMGYANMAAGVAARPENALWHSHFAYRTARLLDRRRGMSAEQRRAGVDRLALEIAENGIRRYAGDYSIALHVAMYQLRD